MRHFAIASIVLFCLIAESTDVVRAQPATATNCDDIILAVAANPSDAAIAALQKCVGPARAVHVLSQLLRRPRPSPPKVPSTPSTGRSTVGLQRVSPPAIGPNTPVAVYRDGTFVPTTSGADTKQLTLTRGGVNETGFVPDASGAVNVPLKLVPEIMAYQKKQVQTLSESDTLQRQQIAAGQAQLVNALQPSPRCVYKNSWASALTGGSALAANAPIWTRTQVGILGLLLPIVFAPCDRGAPPPNKPVVSVDPATITTTTQAKLTVTEKGYTGVFLVSTQDPFVTVEPVPTSKTEFTIKGQTPGTAALVITDESGNTATANVIVTAGVLDTAKPVGTLAAPTIAANAATTLTVSEKDYTGDFLASSTDSSIAITPVPGAKNQWTITAKTPGVATITLTDQAGKTSAVKVTVTAVPPPK